MNENQYQNKIYQYAFWLSISIAVIGAIILYLSASKFDQEVKEQMFSVASNLLSSVIFAIVFSFLANKEFVHLIKDKIVGVGDEIAIKLLEDNKKQNTKHIPNNSYFPTKNVDTIFNRDLSLDLKDSTYYFFKGVSAKYVPIRIRYTRNNLSEVKVLIMNPQDNYSINLRAKDRHRNPKYSGKSIEDLIKGVRKEIYSCIVSLFDARHNCPIEIAYENGTAVTRLEIFDSSMYLALYHTSDASTQAFPETFRYTKNSVQFNLHRLDCFRQFNICQNKIKFESTSDTNVLLNHLREIGMSNPTLTDIDRIRTENEEFAIKFVNTSQINQI